MQAVRAINILRVLAGILLAVSIFAPLYSVPTSMRGDAQPIYTWDLARENAGSAVLLAVAYLGPAAVIVLCGCHPSRVWSVLLLAAGLILLAISAAILLALADLAFTFLPILGPWLFVPASGSIGAGLWLALAADAVLFILSLALAGSHLRAPSPSLR